MKYLVDLFRPLAAYDEQRYHGYGHQLKADGGLVDGENERVRKIQHENNVHRQGLNRDMRNPNWYITVTLGTAHPKGWL